MPPHPAAPEIATMKTTQTIRISVRGRLSRRLAAAFDGLSAIPRAGATDLVGEVADQAQLHGLLARIRDLGLELESVSLSDTCSADTPEPKPSADGRAD